MITGWSIAIHGGAGGMTPANLSPHLDAEYRSALAIALHAGVQVLEAGGAALDAACASVAALEDDPLFNAGRGSVLAANGRIELDAAVMDGATRAAGAIAGVIGVRNPVRLARAVMAQGQHVFLAREGAEEFAREQGLEMAGPEWFVTPERARQLDEFLARKGGGFDIDVKYGTVGAVVRDGHGHLAAATSTGGLTAKRWARIGDSPVIGAGTWADDRACAVSATGAGEFFIRAGAGHEIAARMRHLGEDAQTAANHVIAEIAALGGKGGVIVAAPDGSTAFSFSTPGMYRARLDSTGNGEVAIFADERLRG